MNRIFQLVVNNMEIGVANLRNNRSIGNLLSPIVHEPRPNHPHNRSRWIIIILNIRLITLHRQLLPPAFLNREEPDFSLKIW